ncbi:MAG: hypothetical protein WD431_07325 [Cyclobacteriaceae bacterium]
MKITFIVMIFATLAIFFSCNNNEEPTAQGIRNVNSNFCDRINGVEGLYWDITNGSNFMGIGIL